MSVAILQKGIQIRPCDMCSDIHMQTADKYVDKDMNVCMYEYVCIYLLVEALFIFIYFFILTEVKYNFIT